MNAYEVRAGRHFWSTLGALRDKYTREQFSGTGEHDKSLHP